MTIKTDFSLILAVYFALLSFGIVYNLAVAWLEKRGYLEGFTWLAVVVGAGATLAGMAILSWQFALIGLGAFAMSGAPMALGAIVRYLRARQAEKDALRGQYHV